VIHLVTAVVAIAYRRRTLVAAAVVVALGLSAAGARRVSFDADVLSLLPRNGRVIPAFKEYLSSFGSVDQLYVVFTAPADHAVTEYVDEIDDWIDRLRQAPEVAHVDAGVATSRGSRIADCSCSPVSRSRPHWSASAPAGSAWPWRLAANCWRFRLRRWPTWSGTIRLA
jgi:predicted RND superfamily exporter protein